MNTLLIILFVIILILIALVFTQESEIKSLKRENKRLNMEVDNQKLVIDSARMMVHELMNEKKTNTQKQSHEE